MTTVIFDLSNIAYKSLHLSKRDIGEVGWLFFKHLMFNQIISLCKKFGPDEVILAVDSKENWRKKIYPEYKAHRKDIREKQDDIDWNMFFSTYEEFVSEVKEFFPFIVLKIKYAEADDIIGVFARDMQHKDKVIISADQDYLQLLKYKNVKIWDPTGNRFLTCDDPDRYLKVKCLMGDRGDNVMSVKARVGEKTAEKLVDNPELLREMFEDPTISYTKPDGGIVTLGDECKEKFKTITALVDLDKTPKVICDAVKKVYSEYQVPSGKKIFSYFSQNKFRELMRNMNDLENIIVSINNRLEIEKQTSEVFGV